MAKKVAVTRLNASTIDVLNTIRQNASAEYRDLVPEVKKAKDIPKVGEVLYGYPALANQFLNALITRIAFVDIKSSTFNDDYAEFKKGYLEFGETVEEVFVNIAKAREFSVAKADSREFKRTLPDVRSAFHAMNWRVQYPITVQDEDLRTSFTSMDGVQDMIAKIVDSVNQANEYDEYLLFKYLMIKGITSGKMYPVSIGDGTTMTDAAVQFRRMSNQLQFMSTKYNASGVHTTTSKEDQYIFMDSEYNAKFDVNVLASAFNMDKATFMGKLKLVDDWTTFDNDRFSDIVAGSDMIEPVTDAELALMKNVKAVLLDKEWFQVYDNNNKMTEQYVASGMYWNYFFNVWKTVSSSPFSNAIVFVTDSADVALPTTINYMIDSVSTSNNGEVITFVSTNDDVVANHNANFVQTEQLTKAGIAVHKYGALIVPSTANIPSDGIVLTASIDGTTYSSKPVTYGDLLEPGKSIALTKV